MIFVSVGTHEVPFTRLLDAVARLAANSDEEFIVQYGHAPPPNMNGMVQPFFTFHEMVAHIREARVYICHAGSGSTMLALHEGKIPVVVPRRPDLGEHVDDHQLRFAYDLADRVIPVFDVAVLPEVLSNFETLASTKVKPLQGNPHAEKIARRLDAVCRDLLAGAKFSKD